MMKIRLFTALLITLAALVFISLNAMALADDSVSGWTGTACYESAGKWKTPRGEVAYPYHVDSKPWGYGVWCDTRPGNVSLTCRITKTFDWDWSRGNPPQSMIIKETAVAYWTVDNIMGDPPGTIAANGWATTSLGGSYHEDNYHYGTFDSGLTNELLLLENAGICGVSECVRYVRVDTSSGHFTRTINCSSEVTATSSAFPYSEVFARCTTEIASADGIPFTLISPSPPGRDASPLDHPVGDDPVNLATGVQSLLLAPDIVSYNPYGPSPAYTRNYHSARAKSNHASPGLSAGWIDNYDVSITTAAPGAWGALKLRYPNGAEESLTPVLNAGQPTGEFTATAGAPFFVTGVPSATTGKWQSIKITFSDQSKWIFAPAGSNDYSLDKIANRMDRYISILRDSSKGNRITFVKDDSSPAHNLLAFAYNSRFLASITDIYGRKVAYTFGAAAGATCLLSFSGIVPSQTANPAARTTYGYTAIGAPASPLLTSITDLSPTGSGTKTDTINYYMDPADGFSYGKLRSLVDDHGNKHEYIYESDSGTRVRSKNPAGNIEAQWVANFDPANGRSTGITDNSGHYTNVYYTDPRNPSKPTAATDKTGKQTVATYDQYGNILTSKDLRGTVTTCTYSYTAFPLGRLMSVRQGSKPATTFTYFEPSGLIESVTTPKPGATDNSTVTTWFTYDTLGNVKTVKKPGNNAAATITTVYDYGQQPKLGQPLTIVDVVDPTDLSDPGWSRMVHLSYDARGNMLSATDVQGNKVDYTYNVANQPLLTILPATP